MLSVPLAESSSLPYLPNGWIKVIGLIQQKMQWLKLINSSLSDYIERLEHIESLIDRI